MRPATSRNYLLSLLVAVLAVNFLERSAMNLLLQDIKLDLRITDTQLGLLTGIAFSVFYAVFGLPIARWADRGDRAKIIAITLGVQGIAVSLCGMAGSFAKLMLIRILVAIGEAGCVPAAHSLIATYFARAERPRAFSIYMLGTPLSAMIGSVGAGWLNELYGWRMTFMVMGIPSLMCGCLAWLTIEDPRRLGPGTSCVGVASAEMAHGAPTAHFRNSIKSAVKWLWAIRTFRHLLVGYSVVYFFTVGIWKWQPAFYIRSHGLGTRELGFWFAGIYGIGGLLGTYLGGEWAARRAAYNERLQLRVMGSVYAIFGVITAGMYLVRSPYVAFGLMFLATIGIYATFGPLFATIQTLVPERARATAIAIVYFVANLIGLGVGPLVAGGLSDAFHPLLGQESLRFALLAMCPGYFWAGWHVWRGSVTVAGDVERSLALFGVAARGARRAGS